MCSHRSHAKSDSDGEDGDDEEGAGGGSGCEDAAMDGAGDRGTKTKSRQLL